MIFLLMAAHDTTTITMSSMAYHLAKNPEWQERARAESLAAGDVDYDGVLRPRRARPGDEGVDAAVLAGALAPPRGGARHRRSAATTSRRARS